MSAEKKPCKISLSDDLMELIEFKCKIENKFKEQVFEDAIVQMICPRLGEIGLGHPDFFFKAPLVKSENVKTIMFWIQIKFWKRLKEIKMNHRASIHAIVYTALTFHLKQYREKLKNIQQN